MEIQEIKHSSSIIIRSTYFLFRKDKTRSSGFIAYWESKKLFGYPILSDPESEPIQFLLEATLVNKKFKEIMNEVYQKKGNIILDGKTIFWGEYEFLFKQEPFYIHNRRESAKIIEL
jgi:hypothetical protein